MIMENVSWSVDTKKREKGVEYTHDMNIKRPIMKGLRQVGAKPLRKVASTSSGAWLGAISPSEMVIQAV